MEDNHLEVVNLLGERWQIHIRKIMIKSKKNVFFQEVIFIFSYALVLFIYLYKYMI